MKRTFQILIIGIILTACKNKPKDVEPIATANNYSEKADNGKPVIDENLIINPVEHASMILNWDGTIIYVDPVDEPEMYAKYPKPSMVLITDIHSDHFDVATLEAIVGEKASIIAPQAVFEKLPKSLQIKTEVMKNGAKTANNEIKIEAIPMYNLRPEALKFHEKGRGNGYVLEKNGKRVYISGDTEDIPEMRNLKNIDVAFVCMNLPYTMTVEKAAEAVLGFQPKNVYPYHYRGENGLSDVAKFKSLVEAGNPNIKVTQLDWYPKK